MSPRADLALVLRCEPARDGLAVPDLLLDVLLPQLTAFRRLEANSLPFELTLSFTPRLITQLRAADLERRVEARVAARKAHLLLALEGAAEEAARFDLGLLDESLELLMDLEGDVLSEYARLSEAGFLELAAGTDGHLPLLAQGARVEIEAAVAAHAAAFGVEPQGICLHGDGYSPGVEALLEAAGLRYVFTAPAAVERAEAKPLYGRFAPMLCAGTSVVAFPADPESERCLCEGALHLEYRLRDGLSPFFRVTSEAPVKGFYRPHQALDQIEAHARGFLLARLDQADILSAYMDRPPLMVTLLPAALFGAQWFEGPYFLESLFELLYVEAEGLRLITPKRYLEDAPTHQIARLAPSSSCDARALCNQKNNWIYPRLHGASRRLEALRGAAGDAQADAFADAFADAAARLGEAQRASWAERMSVDAGLDAAEALAGFLDALAAAEGAIHAVEGAAQ